MNVYRIELMVIDYDDIGIEDIKAEIEHAPYHNRCISPVVMGHDWRELGEWDDEHPLNHLDPSIRNAEWRRLY